MGYEIHITRKTEWFADEGPAILLEEWLEYVASDPDMRTDSYAEAHLPGDVLRVDDESIAVWAAYTGHNAARNMAWFYHFDDCITVKNPDQEIYAKCTRLH